MKLGLAIGFLMGFGVVSFVMLYYFQESSLRSHYWAVQQKQDRYVVLTYSYFNDSKADYERRLFCSILDNQVLLENLLPRLNDRAFLYGNPLPDQPDYDFIYSVGGVDKIKLIDQFSELCIAEISEIK